MPVFVPIPRIRAGASMVDSGHLDLKVTLSQVSLRTSQTQLVLSGEGEDFLLTLWEPGRPGKGSSYSLDVLRSHGCTPAMHQHLRHALRLLHSVQ